MAVPRERYQVRSPAVFCKLLRVMYVRARSITVCFLHGDEDIFSPYGSTPEIIHRHEPVFFLFSLCDDLTLSWLLFLAPCPLLPRWHAFHFSGYEATMYGCEGSVRQTWEFSAEGKITLADYYGAEYDWYSPLCMSRDLVVGALDRSSQSG